MDINVLLGAAGEVFNVLERATKKVMVEFFKEDSTVAQVVPDEPPGKNLITRHQLLDMLKISPSTLCNWQNKGLIHPIKFGRKVFFDLNEVLSIKEVKNIKHGEIFNFSRSKSS